MHQRSGHIARRIPLASLALLAVCLTPARASAQTCAGGPAFARHAWHVDAGALNGSPYRGVGLQVAGGGENAFVRASIGAEGTRARDGDTSDLFRLGAGFRVPLDERGRVELCPIFSLGLGRGPQRIWVGSGDDVDDRISSGVGLAIGAEYRVRPGLRLSPSVQVGLEVEQTSWIGQTLEADSNVTERYGYAVLSLGVEVGRIVTLRPSVSLPGARRFDGPLVGLSVGVGVLRREF